MITDAGIKRLGSWEPLPAGSALIDYWRRRLGKAARLSLETLTQVYSDGLAKSRPKPATSERRRFQHALGRLRTPELVQGRGELRAGNNLFAADSEVEASLSVMGIGGNA